MGLFGGSGRGYGAGLVETPEQRAEAERIARMYGMDPNTPAREIDPRDLSMDSITNGQLPGNPTQPAPPAEKPRGFWSGGDKFRAQDGLAAVLAALGDAFAQQAGMEGGAVKNLTGGRASAIDLARTAAMKQQEREAARQRAVAAGFAGPQADMLAHGDAKPGDFRSPNPYRWESNSGNLMELGPNDQPVVRYQDPTPRMNFIPDGMGGGRWVPLPTQQTDPTSPVGKLTPITGGGTGNGAGGFPYRYRR